MNPQQVHLSHIIWKPAVLVVLSHLLFTCGLSSQESLQVQTNWWIPNGSVYSIVRDGNTVYIGGEFTSLGPFEPYGTAVDITLGIFNSNFTHPNERVNAAIPDGEGGWYIGGGFTEVGGQMRNRLARINADGTLHPWNPDASGTVNTLALSEGLVYVGGSFNSIGGQTRNRIAAVDAATGAVTSFDPNANNNVQSLVVSGSSLYVGGSFTSIGGETRNRLAEINTITGVVTTWNPDANNTVWTLAVSGNTMYVGGAFTSLGGQTRNRIAAVDAITGAVTQWNPNATGTVFTIALSGGVVYVGGNFSSIGGQSRNKVAALDSGSGEATSWDPDASANGNFWVNTISVYEGVVYVGGTFNRIGGQWRDHIAALDATTGLANSWKPNAGREVSTISVSGNAVYVGGFFLTMNGEIRNHIAAFDATTGVLTPWNPNPNNKIWTLAVRENSVYAGGEFTMIGGEPRNFIAKLDATTGAATSWNPNANVGVISLAFKDSILFAGGGFTNIGGQARSRIAALNSETGAATSWNPGSSHPVHTLEVSENILYAGGYFTSIGGQARNRIAAIDATTGAVTPWNPNASDLVRDIEANGSTIYVAGDFNNIGGTSRPALAAIDSATGTATSWDPDFDGSVRVLTLKDSTLYVGGNFSSSILPWYTRLARLDVTTGTFSSWIPVYSSQSNTIVYAVEVGENALYTAGLFDSVDGIPRSRFAVFTGLSISSISTDLADGICSGTSGSVSFTAEDTFNPDNVFTAQLSNASGDFTNPVNIGSLASTTSGSISVTIPAGTPSGSGYRVRVVSSSPGIISMDNGNDILINVVVSLTALPATCNLMNGSINTELLGGVGPFSYIWNNGSTTANPQDLPPGNYSVTVTDDSGCTGFATATIVSDNNFNPAVNLSGGSYQTGSSYTAIWSGFPTNSQNSVNVSNDGGATWTMLLSNQAANGSASITLPETLAAGSWLLQVEADNGCAATLELLVTSAVVPNRIEFFENVQPNTSDNQFNTITPGLPLRFKLKVQNNHTTSLPSPGGTLRSLSPWVAITDSLSTYSFIFTGQQGWGQDEFEIMIDPATPPGAEAVFEFWLEDQVSPDGPWVSTFTIPLRPFQTNFLVIDDDANPDSNGDDDDIAEPGETVEISPLLENSSDRTIHNTSAQLLSPYENVSVWNNLQGVNAVVMDTYRYNYASGNWQPISPLSTNNTPEEDYVFDYNFEQPFGITLCMVVSGYPDAAMGSTWDTGGVLHRWTVCFPLNEGFPNADTTTFVADGAQQPGGFTIYPNPASNELYILSLERSDIKEYVATLRDMSGRVVQEVQASGSARTTLQLALVPSGVYTLSLRSVQGIFTRKVVVSR